MDPGETHPAHWHRGMVTLILSVLVLGGCLGASPRPGILMLCLSHAATGERILSLPLAPGEPFTLHYYHSVEQAPIWETHTLDEQGRIYMEEERYEKFGAGMGKMPGVGRMVREGPHEVIKDMHMEVGAFVLRVGSPAVAHTLIWRGQKFNLSHAHSHQAIRFYGCFKSQNR